MAKNTLEEFIEKARNAHGNKYDYSKVEYINSQTKVCIICPEHGEFWQTPANHLFGTKCPKCTHRSYKKTTKEFIEEAKRVHGDKYDYSKVNYIDNRTKVCIICAKHGEFWQNPTTHIMGAGCQKCYDEKRGTKTKKSKEEFINELKTIYSDKYDHSKIDYVNNKKKVCIICPEHGEFWITPLHLLQRKNGCPMCSIKNKNEKRICTTENFIEKAKKIHGDYYDYSLVDYKGAKKEVKIICPKHGTFLQKPNYHLSSNGCPKCKMSKLEFDILTELNKKNIKHEFHSRPQFLNGLELDFYFPDIKIAIECQGRQHYTPINFFGGIEGFKSVVKRDEMKKNICEDNHIELLYYTKENVSGKNIFHEKEEIINKIKQKQDERNNS